MGAIWLDGRDPDYPALDAVIRGAGLQLRTWEGWQHNSRGSGGFDALLGVIAHHTASPPSSSFDNDWRYCAVGHQDAPVANMLLGRDGMVGLHAAGASNHAGKGGPWATSGGTVPVDSANARILGIEAQNSGVGEQWAPVMVDAYERLVAALCAAYGFVPVTDCAAHFEWAPSRKIDPWGGSSPTPGFAYTGPDEWDMAGFTAGVAARMAGITPPLPPEEDTVTDDDIARIAQQVWASLIYNYVNGDNLPAVSMLGYAHAEAYEGSFQRVAANMVDGQQQTLADLLRFAHGEAYGANAKCDRILAILGALEPPPPDTGDA